MGNAPVHDGEPKIVFVVLVGRFQLALETIRDFIELSCLAQGNPILAYFFPGALSEKQRAVIEAISPNIETLPTTLQFPRFADSEMFYSRKNQYARKFGRSRMGYLDMCFWTTHFFSEPRLAAFDFILRFDDDSHLLGCPDVHIQDALEDDHWVVASANVNSSLGQNNLDTREQFFEFTKQYVQSKDIEVRDGGMRNALSSNDAYAFHSLPRTLGNFNLYRASVFRSASWFSWAYEVVLFGGHHRFRWSDIIVTGTFARLGFNDPIRNLLMVEDGIYKKNTPGAGPIRRGPMKYLSRLSGVLRTVRVRDK